MTNTENNYFTQIYFLNKINCFLNIFYNIKKFPSSNYSKKYIENYKKLPILYTNPKWNPIQKKLIFNSFDFELNKSKSKKDLFFLTSSNYSKKYIKNYKKLPILFTNPKWNPIQKKLIFNSFDFELDKHKHKHKHKHKYNL